MKKILIALLVVSCFLQISCSPDVVKNTPTTNPVDVYVAGSKNNHACYWKNNQLVMLDSGGLDSITTKKIIVSNNDVYVLGSSRNDTLSSILFWKNGVLTNLSNTLSSSNDQLFSLDMDVVGNDVYFAGYTGVNSSPYFKFNYWKNNNKTVLNDNISATVFNVEIKANNNNLYITGSYDNRVGYYINTNFYDANNNSGLALNNTDMFYYSYVYGTTIARYKNLSTNVDSSFLVYSYLKKLAFDNNNLYYLDGNDLYKNGAVLVSNNVLNFNVLNDNVYKIIGVETNSNSPISLQINNTTTMTASSGEHFNSLYIVQK